MNLPNLNHVYGNVTAVDHNKDKRLKASNETNVAIASTDTENDDDVWSIVPQPGNNLLVSFQSKKYKDRYLGFAIKDSNTCIAVMESKETLFKLEPAGKDGADVVYKIQPAQGSPEILQNYLTIDEANGGKKISLKPEMRDTMSKQKWKFKKIPASS